MLEYKNVEVSFEKQAVLHDFTLTIGESEITALVGESGSGKTTAIRAAMGLLPVGGEVSGGDIILDGKSILNTTEKEYNPIRGTKLSMIFQDSGAMLNPVRTIGSQFVEFIRAHEKITKALAWEKARKQLENTGLPHSEVIMKAIPADLSGGMRQRVGIAMGMTYTPQILFADEPTSALDVTIQSQIVKQLAELRGMANTSIVLVTHDLAVAAYLADTIVVMQNGRIVESGKAQSLVASPQCDYTKNLIAAIPDFRRQSYV